MFFFVKPKIHLDVFTSRKDVIENATIIPATQALPKWWSALPKSYMREGDITVLPTMKTCVGFIDYYRHSVAMPLWSEMIIKVEKDGSYKWQFADRQTIAGVHSTEQFKGLIKDNQYGHIKVEAPWVFSSKQDINWLMTQPIYNEANFLDYTTGIGMLNFSKQEQVNIQMFVDLRYPKTYTLKFQTPFLFTPLSDKKVVIHRHLISAEEYNSRKNFARTHFVNSYRNKKDIIKCPYHNHFEGETK